MGSLKNVIIPFRIKIIEKPHTQTYFCYQTSDFKLQQEVLKLNDICVSCSPPKSDLVINFLNLDNRSFESVSFSQ